MWAPPCKDFKGFPLASYSIGYQSGAKFELSQLGFMGLIRLKEKL
jgi:hypothetical protein